MGWLIGCFMVYIIITVVRGQNAELIIQPNDKVVRKPEGESLALTCKPNVDDPNLITQLEWKDPKGRRIDSTTRDIPMHVQDLQGEVGKRLLISKLSETLEGNYTCTANYANSERLGASVTVETYVDVTFVRAPEAQYAKVGQDYVVQCKVQARPLPYVGWSKDDEDIKVGDKYVIVTDGLKIRNVQVSDDGTYRCTAIVPNTGTIRERNIKLEVQIPPVIEPMEPISVIEGETATVKCLARGKPPPKYTWVKDNTRENLKVTDRFDVKENTGDLFITRVESGDDGVYICKAENSAGVVQTPVRINVLVKPKIYELINQTAPIGSETKIICKTQGRPPPNVIFRKLSTIEPFKIGQQLLDRRITVEPQYFEEKGESFATLIISQLNRSDDGLYECRAENKAGVAYKRGHITVQFPPTFERTRDFPPAWSWGDKPGNLSCIPEAIPNATIIWKYGGILIQDSPVFKIMGHGPQSNLLVYPRNEERFFGKYECEASNSLGKASNFIELRRASIPEPIQQVKTEYITATSIKFNIVPPRQFRGLPLRYITVQYRPERELAWESARNHTWSFNSPYVLDNLMPEWIYRLRFAAGNDVGMGPWMDAIPVQMPRRSEPAEPKIFVPHDMIINNNTTNREDIMAVSPYADHLDLRWSVPVDNGDPIDEYQIRYCISNKINGYWRDSDCSEQIRQSVQYTSYELNGLHPDTVYKIEVRAHNAIGSSSPAQIRIKTARGVDPIVPVESPSVSSAAIIGIVVAAIFLVLLVVDLTCFCVNRTGILALICQRAKKHNEEDDPKLGSYKAAPAHPNSLNLPMPVKLLPTPTPTEEREPLKQDHNQMNGEEKQFRVEYNGGQVYSKTGEIIGKHSAV